MAHDSDLVVRERGRSLFNGWCNAISRVDPGVPETAVRSTSRADVGGGSVEVEVREPGVDGGCAAERNDDEAVCVVEGDVAGYVG